MIPDEDEMKAIPVRYGVFMDPSGYNVEIKESTNQECKIVMGVIDLDESIEFYSNVLNMNLLRKRSNTHNRPKEASMCAHMVLLHIHIVTLHKSISFNFEQSFDNSEEDSTYIELLYRYGTEDVLNLGTTMQKVVDPILVNKLLIFRFSVSSLGIRFVSSDSTIARKGTGS